MNLRFKVTAIFIVFTLLFGVQSFAAMTSAKIRFTLNTTAKITLKLFDSNNVQRKTFALWKTYKKGSYSISWNLLDAKGRRVTPGKYRFNLTAKNAVNAVVKNLTVQVIANNKVKFEAMKYSSSIDVSVWNNAKDSNNKTYSSGLLFGLTGAREIDLQKKYKQFKGTIVVPYEDLALSNSSSILVYLDDVLVLTTTPQNRVSEPYQINLNVANASKINFVISINRYGENLNPPRLGFVNTYFYK